MGPVCVHIGQFNGSGTLAGEGSAAPTGQFVDPEAIAIDNSGDPLTDPSVVMCMSWMRVIKWSTSLSAAGAYMGQLTEGAPASPFEVFDGVAIDQNGILWIDNMSYDSNAKPIIDSFSDAVANEFLSAREAQLGLVEPGFAVDSEDNLYVDWKGADSIHVAAKLNSSGSIVKGEVDTEESTVALAVDLSNTICMSTTSVI